MTATATEAPALRYEELPLADLRPNPNDPRSKEPPDAGLVASIEALGVLSPLRVEEVEGGYQIIFGHRRHRAAEKAKCERVPCLVGPPLPGELERLVGAITENVQRKALTALEEARGYQQALNLGMSAEDLARATGAPAATVTAAATVAKSKAAAKAQKEVPTLTFEMAAGIAEFEGDKHVVTRLGFAAAEGAGSFAHELSAARQEREEEAALTKAQEEVKAAGFVVLDRRPNYGGDNPVGLNELQTEGGAKITAATHAKCPYRAVYLRTDHRGAVEANYYCTNPTKGGHKHRHRQSSPARGSGAAKGSEAEQEKARKERREVLACNRASRAAEPVRRQFVRDLLKRSKVPDSALTWASAELLLSRIDPSASTALADLTGEEAIRRGSGNSLAEAILAKIPPTRAALRVVAYVAADLEGNADPSRTWRKDYYRRDAFKRYLEFLRFAGYDLALVERVIVGDAKPADVVNAEALAKSSRAPAEPTKAAKRAPVAKRVQKVAKARKAAKRPSRAARRAARS